MRAERLHREVRRAFEDFAVPEFRTVREAVRRLHQDIDGLRAELIAEIRRLDARIDGVDRELRTAIEIRERLAALEARRPA
jgi:transposase